MTWVFTLEFELLKRKAASCTFYSLLKVQLSRTSFFRLLFASPQHYLIPEPGFQSTQALLLFPTPSSSPFTSQQLKDFTLAINSEFLGSFCHCFTETSKILLVTDTLSICLTQQTSQTQVLVKALAHVFIRCTLPSPLSPACLELLTGYFDTLKWNLNSSFPLSITCFMFPLTPLFPLLLPCRKLLQDQPTYGLLNTLQTFQRSFNYFFRCVCLCSITTGLSAPTSLIQMLHFRVLFLTQLTSGFSLHTLLTLLPQTRHFYSFIFNTNYLIHSLNLFFSFHPCTF